MFSPSGEVVARVNPFSKHSEQFGVDYSEDIRDPVLKINDDRKIHINLGGIKEVGSMVLLTIKSFDNRSKPTPKEGEFDRAWFRLYNEDTNQTIDYSLLKNIEEPEEYQEVIPAEEEEGVDQWNPLTYFHGVLYLEKREPYNRWVFESYKNAF